MTIEESSDNNAVEVDWSNSQPLQNEYGQVLEYYRYTLVKQPGESSGSWEKLFWRTIIGAAVWLWFFR
jgi:hypothetical protein